MAKTPDRKCNDQHFVMILEMVANYFNESALLIIGLRRGKQSIIKLRHIVMYLAHVCGQISAAEISRISMRDRSTVSFGINKIEDLRDDPTFDSLMDSLCNRYVEEKIKLDVSEKI
ncbi:MAG: helix-turn-helix domain-containing protein [Waterburya sp.]